MVTFIKYLMPFTTVVLSGTTCAWLFKFLTMTCQLLRENIVTLPPAYLGGSPFGFRAFIAMVRLPGGC